jgi:hypothetical protein
MTAFGRLWSRAPAWRAALLLTIVCGALVALFPPVKPEVAAPASQPPVVTHPEPVAAPTQTLAQAPVPAPAMAAATEGNMPIPGQLYADRLPFGSQSVPLPPGRWLAVAVGNNPPASGVPNASVFLALVLGQEIAAAALISGSAAAEPQAAGFLVPADAQIPTFYYRRVLTAVDHGPADFWFCGASLPSKWSDPVRRAAITALAQQHIGVADRFDSAVFRLSDKRNWLSAEFMFPAPAGDAPARAWTEEAGLSDAAMLPHIEKVRRWGKAWHDVLRRGFEGGGDLAGSARIPLP